MPNAPLILSDNLFDNVVLHPSFVVGNSGNDDVAGCEAFRVADNLRDLSSWQSSTLNAARSLYVDCQSAQQPNMIVLDRGHNVAGVQVTIAGYTDTTLATQVAGTAATFTIPQSIGGLPTDPNGCVTNELAFWKTWSPTASARVWALSFPALGAGVAPVVTGLYLGTYYRLTTYLNAPVAPDGRRSVLFERNALSKGGVRVKSRPRVFRKLRVDLDFDAPDYPAFDVHVARLVELGQPWFLCVDDSDASYSANLRLYQHPGDVDFDPALSPAHREIRGLDLEEVIPVLNF